MIPNLLEAKRLVRKIKDFLETGADLSLASKTATDYVEICRYVSLRLKQVETMITAGDFAQALQLAEQSPALPDLLTILDFRKSEEWRALCKEKSLPHSDPFDANAAESLNALYERGITGDHPLYTRYREEMSSRNESRAYQTLRAIVRLNPADTNAVAELSRLDSKVMAAQLAELDSSLTAGDAGGALERLLTIESAGFNTAPSGPAWIRALILRRDMWVQAAEVARRKGLFEDVFDWLERIRELQTTNELPDSIDLVQRSAELEKWAQEQHHQHLLDAEFRALQRQLLIQLESNEQKDTAARVIGTQELREDYETLNRIWRALVDFGRSLPDDMTTRFKKRVAILELQVRRRQERRIALISAATVLALSLITAAALWFVGKMNAGDLAKRFRTLTREREVRQVEQLIETTRKENPQQAARPDVRESIENAEKFLAEENSKLKVFHTSVKDFPAELEANSPPAQIGEWSKRLNAIVEAHRALAPVLAKETASALDELVKRWTSFVEEESGRRQAQFEKLLKTYEDALAGLDFDKPPENVKTMLATASTPSDRSSAWIKETGQILKLRPDSLTRLQNLVQRHKHYSQQTESLYSQDINLRFADKLSDYQSALDGLAGSEFTRDPRVMAARAIKARVLPATVLTQVLLCGQNTNLWNQIKDGKMPDFQPVSIMPTESKLHKALKDTESVATAVHKYQFTLASKEKQLGFFSEQLPARPESGWAKYNGLVLKDGFQSFPEFQKIELGFFGNTWKLPDNSTFSHTYLGQATEPVLFFKTQLHKGIGDPGSPPRMQLIKVLDLIREDRSTSSLFRAWLYLRIVEMMEVQPEGWGLPFAPLIQRHKRDLVAANATMLKGGDWYVEGLNKKLGPDLEVVLSAQKEASYFRQAESLARLFHGVVAGGFEFVGHIGLDGSAYASRGAQDELWGWDIAGKPALIYRRVNLSWVPISKTFVPFTPLYSLKSTRSNLLENAGVNPKDPLFDGRLPALFTLEPQFLELRF
jgi:hypothetical protein